jgi:hypothetical protein
LLRQVLQKFGDAPKCHRLNRLLHNHTIEAVN